MSITFIIIIFAIAVGHILLGFGYLMYKIGINKKDEGKEDNTVTKE